MSTPMYGPDQFYSDITVPDPATVLAAPLPKAWAEGGMIEAVKRTVVTGLRESFQNSSMKSGDTEYSISIEYPTAPTEYPGIWVQFSIESLKRAGIGMGTWVKDADEIWGEIQEWMFTGRITLTIAALTAKDRDRLSDTVIAQLAFARSSDLSLRDPRKDAKEKKGLIETIDSNPYVFMTLNTDEINSGGATVTGGTPWAPNVLLYEDNYSVACTGQFNLRFNHDGVFELHEIRQNPSLMATSTAYNPAQWRGTPPSP